MKVRNYGKNSESGISHFTIMKNDWKIKNDSSVRDYLYWEKYKYSR